jgi:hypothetical protein
VGVTVIIVEGVNIGSIVVDSKLGVIIIVGIIVGSVVKETVGLGFKTLVDDEPIVGKKLTAAGDTDVGIKLSFFEDIALVGSDVGLSTIVELLDGFDSTLLGTSTVD